MTYKDKGIIDIGGYSEEYLYQQLQSITFIPERLKREAQSSIFYRIFFKESKQAVQIEFKDGKTIEVDWRGKDLDIRLACEKANQLIQNAK